MEVVEEAGKVEGIGEEFGGDVGNRISPKNVESKATKAHHGIRIDANPRRVFRKRNIPDVVVAILNSPMVFYEVMEEFGRKKLVRYVERGLRRRNPLFEFCIKLLNMSVNNNKRLGIETPIFIDEPRRVIDMDSSLF